MEPRSRNLQSAGSLVLIAVIFISAVMISSTLFRGWRLDLTSNGQYTLSEGTRNILAGLGEPVNLYLFFSEEASSDLPQIRQYARWVGELLDEMADLSGGKLKVHRVDPRPFSQDEDRAAEFGLQAVPVGATGDSLYFGLAATNTLDDAQAMPFLQPSKEAFLEYDVIKMVSSLSHPDQRRVGIITSLDMQAGYNPATQSMREAWIIYEQLEQAFDLVVISAQQSSLPEGLDLLLVVHPRDFSEELLYAIDQFVLGGGRLMAFMDPFAESDRGANPADPMAALNANSSSTLGVLLDAWGVRFDPSRAVGDLQFALQVSGGAGRPPVRHIGIIGVTGDGLDPEDIVTGDLETINLSSAGWLEPVADAETVFTPLVQTSENAAPFDSLELRFLTDPRALMDGFNPSGDRHALAARISGMANSAFSESGFAESEGHLSQPGQDGINVLLFADTDMLTDQYWVQKQNFFGQVITSAFADNGNLVVNAVDHLLGSPDLISVRTRNTMTRPFQRVELLRLEAESRFRATEERLQSELQETEAKLSEIQSARDDGDLSILSEAQQDEIQRFMDQRAQIRNDLRAVQHDLNRDIDALGTRLKVLNIVLMPILVAASALFYGRYRRRRREGITP